MNEIAEEARPLATVPTQATQERVISTDSPRNHKSIAHPPHPPLCMKCGGRFEVDCFGDITYCTLMVESMREGVPVASCAHFRALCEGCIDQSDCTLAGKREALERCMRVNHGRPSV